MKQFSKKVVSAVLCASMSIGMLTGCSGDKEASTDSTGVATIDVYDDLSNYFRRW